MGVRSCRSQWKVALAAIKGRIIAPLVKTANLFGRSVKSDRNHS